MPRRTEVSIPQDVYDVVVETARALKLSAETLIVQAVYDAFKMAMQTRGIKPPVPPKHMKKETK